MLSCFIFLMASGCAPSTPVVEGGAGERAKAAPKMPAGPGREVDMTIQDYTFMPSEIAAKPGEKLHLVLVNKGQEEHSVDFDLPQGSVQLPSHLLPGESEQYDVLVPDKPGTYYFHCPMGNHYSRGMVGDILVK
jgi:plastocyanin